MSERYGTLITVAALRAHLGEEGWVVVDCRFRLADPEAGEAMYREAHIPGAVYADLNRDLAGPPSPEGGRHPLPDLDGFRERLGAWGIDEGAQVVVYDDAGGSIAARLWWMLRYLGHEAVAVLDGGWQAWQAAGFPTTSGVERGSPTTFHGEPRREMMATMEEVEALVRQGQGHRLLDARDPERYRGEVEPIDPKPGHIPGARNRPYKENLAASGGMREAAELAEAFGEVLGEVGSAEAIVYCGSGVTACHNLLAMEHAGLRGARLFVPSWSGWSSDEGRGVESGA